MKNSVIINLFFTHLLFALAVVSYSFTVIASELPVIRISSTGNNLVPYPPYRWYDNCEKTVSGSIAHILGQTMKQLGYQLEWVVPDLKPGDKNYGHWREAFYEQLATNETDIGLFSKLDHPREYVSTQYPVLWVRQSILTAADGPTPKSLDDLRDGPKGILSPMFGRTLAPVLEQYSLDYSFTDSPEDALRALKNGEADYTVFNHYAGKVLVHKLGLGSDIVFTDIKLFEQPLYLMMNKQHPQTDLLKQIDALNADPTYQDLKNRIHQIFIRKWFQTTDCASMSVEQLDKIIHNIASP